jgi:hypothetical protein
MILLGVRIFFNIWLTNSFILFIDITIPDGAERVGVLADDVLAEESVHAPEEPDRAHQHLVQHCQLVAVLPALLGIRPAKAELHETSAIRADNGRT